MLVLLSSFQALDYIVLLLLLLIFVLGVLYFATSLNITKLNKKTLYSAIIVSGLLVAVATAIEKGPNVDWFTLIVMIFLFVTGLILLFKTDNEKSKEESGSNEENT